MRAARPSLDARRSAIHALGMAGTSAEVASELGAALDVLRAAPRNDGVGQATRDTYVIAFEVIHHLFQWDAETLAAAATAEAHRRSAERRAQLALKGLGDDDRVDPAVRSILNVVATGDVTFEDLENLRAELRRVKQPLALIEPRKSQPRPRSDEAEASSERRPRCMLLFSMDGSPIFGPKMIDGRGAHELTIEARILDWPEWADELSVSFLSKWQGVAATVMPVAAQRAQDDEAEVTTLTAAGGIVVDVPLVSPDAAMRFAPQAELVGGERRELIPIVGYDEIVLHAFDPARHLVTGAETVDRHVYETLVEAADSDASESERRDFCALFRVLANEAQKLVANGTFRRGENVLESEFQTQLRAAAQTTLGADSVRTGGDVSGGRMDIVYRGGLTAELKVERKVSASVQNAARYLGQPAQYSAGAGRQMSILCILDLVESDSPTGILANDVGILRPALAGLEDPAYPSLVGVIVIRGATKLPSDFAGVRVPLLDS